MKLRPEINNLPASAAVVIAGEMLNERWRQAPDERWYERHRFEELAAAGAAYAASAAAEVLRVGLNGSHPVFAAQEWRRWILGRLWPWWSDWFKPKDPRRDLVRAGALIIAAIERLDRETVIAGDAEAG